MAKAFEVRLTAVKGYGIFATRNIEAGTVILTDTRIMCIEGEWWKTESETEHDSILQAFLKSTPDEQARYPELYACPDRSDGQRTIHQIYDTNCFGTFSLISMLLMVTNPILGHDDTSYICLTISRINHACTPNAMCKRDDDAKEFVHAIIPIMAGEELSISYKADIGWLLNRAQRQVLLDTWGFACQCSTCERTNHEIELSDARRKMIWPLHQGDALESKPCLSTTNISQE